MSYAISLQSTYSDGNAPLSGTTTTTADVLAEVQLSATLSATVTADFSYKATSIRSVYILLSGMNVGDTVTLTTYAALKGAQGSALDTITLTQGVPFLWIVGQGTNPLQVVTNVLSIKAVNGVARTGTIEIRVGYNS